MATFSKVRIISCSGCSMFFPKSQLQGVGNQYVCAKCMGIWNLVISPTVEVDKRA